MKKIYYLLGLLFITGISYAGYKKDSISIAGRFKGNVSEGKIALKKFEVGAFEVAAGSLVNGEFSIKVAELPSGVYRLQYGKILNDHIDIIINNSEKVIYFEMDTEAQNELPNFISSEENKKWYAYQKESRLQLKKISESQDRAIIEKESAVFYKKLNSFLKSNKGTWAGEMVKNMQHRFDEQQLKNQSYRENHFWDGIDTSNPKLLSSPLYVDHIFNYVKYYMDPKNGFSEEERTDHFISGAKVIMEKFGKNQETQKFALQYLSLGFKQIGEEIALQFLDENYGDLVSQCLNETEKSEHEMRLASYKLTKPGTKAKNIVFANASGKLQNLDDLKTNQTIIVFWSSSCPHCMEEMPKINEWASQNPEAVVLGISLDKHKLDFETAAKNFPNIIAYCDFKGWESQPALDYNVMGTPTFLVLDKDKKIIGKYGSFKKIKLAEVLK